MNYRFATFSALLLAACTAGPERPQTMDFFPPVMELRGRIMDPPAGGVDSADLSAYWIRDNHNPVDEAYVGSGATQNLSEDGLDDLQFLLHADGMELYSTEGTIGNLRFFRLIATLAGPCPDQTLCTRNYPGYWEEPGLLLVYALQSARWSPFGPTGQTIDLPQGYSLLKRSCGPTAGQVLMEVRPVGDALELRHRASANPFYSGFDVEESERSFVATCGAVPPKVDMGVRASFDVAETMVWSRDGSSIYYLSPAADDDPTHSVGLREVRLADASAWELATVPGGRGLQLGKPGELFVTTQDALLRVTTAASPSLVPVPLATQAAAARVSPDGRWLGYNESHDGAIGPDWKAHVIDLDTGANMADLDGLFAEWSPDGRFAFWSMSATTLHIASMVQPTVVLATYSVASAVQSQALIWTQGGILLASPPRIWIQEPYRWGCNECFGLTLLDPATRATRTVLDATAGLLSMMESPMLDTAFTGAENCLGLWQTVCSQSLLRINVTSGSVQTVATLSSSVPAALSPDGKRIAFATPKGIYVKDLPQ